MPEEERTRVNITLPPAMAQEMEDLCILVRDLKISMLMELAVKDFIIKIKTKGGPRLEAGLKALTEARVSIDLS